MYFALIGCYGCFCMSVDLVFVILLFSKITLTCVYKPPDGHFTILLDNYSCTQLLLLIRGISRIGRINGEEIIKIQKLSQQKIA